ncbi:MAG: hypothetical protein M1828_001228 [Chrysothrix sp. TS-e1954]|nr:MAG: hypothetical protein M1828_001228 [Chrysothrix sp. TS-e1954]
MALHLQRQIFFGTYHVNAQVFHVTPLSFALVNLKPLLPGHVLVSPLRVVSRFSELSSAEVSDLFHTTQSVGRTIERVFGASALNIAIQDGAAAGQSVPHVHAHVIPRKHADMDDKGGSDAIYQMLEGPEGDLGRHQAGKSKFPAPDADRQPRSEEEMNKEAQWLAEEMRRNP